MQFRILGSLQATSNGAVADLGPPKQRALLAILLMHVGEIVSVDRLVELLWGEAPPRTALHSIQIYVSDLRKALATLTGDDVIVTRQPGYVLSAEPETIDAWQFEQLVRDGVMALDHGEGDAGRGLLREAIALWRGPALTDFAYEEFAQPYIRRLNDLHLDAIEVLASAELDAGKGAESVAMLEAAIREDPLRERSRELLMLALYRSGRHADALRTFASLQAQLADELGIEPSPNIRGLYDRILLHDPSLRPEEDGAGEDRPSRNPYKGLRSFTETDAPDFFGRDNLVAELERRVVAGERLVSLVGPSGSGKSSVVSAGLIPRLRSGVADVSGGWRVVTMAPGPNPLVTAEAALGSGGFAGSGTASPTLLFIDQFEQVFTVAEEGPRAAFLDALATAVADRESSVRVMLTLRADYYDRPLMYPSFAAAFTPSVVNVLPLSPQELEAAVVEPAAQVGVEIEPALLAELVADTADRPGSLPLLQFALTELFDQRSGQTLSRAGYTGLGGLRGLLSRRAEELYRGLGPDGKAAVMQVFLRLVRLDGTAAASRRRIALAELTDLGIDPVLLSRVLATFGNHRLLTFDRDPSSGTATVEVAHEALLVEWDRLAEWIDRYRSIIRRHGALTLAADEWEESGRQREYLLTGSRLAEFEPWLDGGVVQLTGRERAFLDAGLEQRRSAEAETAAQAATQRRLERRARSRLIGLVAVVAILAGVVTYALLVGIGASSTRVALGSWADQGSFYQIVSSGFDRGVSDFGFVATKTLVGKWWDPETGTFDDEGYTNEMNKIFGEMPALVVLMDVVVDEADALAREQPGQHFAVVDQAGSQPNVTYLTFAEEEGAYLAGVAAALTSKTGTIGFIGGLDFPVIWRFEAGYAAGARAVDRDISIQVAYLSEFGDLEGGFRNPGGAEAAARTMFAEGADVILHAAGDSGAGLFEATAAMSDEMQQQLWAIGVDTDQYVTAPLLPGAIRAEAWRPHILTSIVKELDQAVYLALEAVAQGRFVSGPTGYGLKSGLLDLSFSGGFINDIKPAIDGYRQSIMNGVIQVPCVPDDRLEQALDFGVSPDDCGGS